MGLRVTGEVRLVVGIVIFIGEATWCHVGEAREPDCGLFREGCSCDC